MPHRELKSLTRDIEKWINSYQKSNNRVIQLDFKINDHPFILTIGSEIVLSDPNLNYTDVRDRRSILTYLINIY